MAFGIPPLLNKATGVLNTASLLVADATSLAGLLSSGTSWGIYLDGDLVIEPDSIVAFDFKQDFHIADYPMEKGAFESYNKVTTPYDARITMTKGGNDIDRQDFLNTLDDIAHSLDLYDVVTPERTYISVNVAHNDYRRRAHNGLGLITVELWLIQVRETVIPVYTTTATPAGTAAVGSTPGNVAPVTAPAAPSGASPLNLGTVQPQIPLPAVTSAVTSRINQLNSVISNVQSRLP